ncbi:MULTISPECIES: NAD-dependent epimerase/dehydratase family protein [unclassified Paenibacillus]|uniref:NAD-dependent epimerase/dehydratase family protein n=1 Tax=unclassified Paenibacillus TaxID=185978 RepID=UPI0024056A69|nr:MULTISPECIES: NAD-dependent epimerase/dehydratase family protein [unclassified Paenibacillus]MDF9844052.1 nucleoside-diphosphate-sugar epimerase [Paenibacillus sp. PastF-2]MDF9850657.1 nucleoside-diphosphate-sugar epimerase [Paenibacillus sp. PastM-2]MDF9857192.1 nucleoside-diphosphate-sugar epimerase [Paenibacillus sp. PastF-1]MDH6482507.1 nucleoside-diphosphate-sugar epimerase [Paenibacillus sp. PastH-2]MDH6509890.1 nucleoside-diphosphate-sugar epimerase [Paenibacillus sp. PastM-3]
MEKRKILITGKGSYVGTSLIEWLHQWPDQYEVEELSVRGNTWREYDFSKYDVVLHVAGIAHVSSDPKMEEHYYKVNRDLAIEVAKKAKQENVKQFIFMSSMIIYGADSKIGEKKVITKDTLPDPSDFYGRSKLEADLEIGKMNNEFYKTVCVRTPMVYGPKCKGNFPRLKQLAGKTPVFPNIMNQRSMIFIDNLCEFLRKIIDNSLAGIFFPQNKDYVSTTEIIRIMGSQMERKIVFVKGFNPLLRVLSNRVKMINKIFGNKIYDHASSPSFEYCVVDFEESIKISM